MAGIVHCSACCRFACRFFFFQAADGIRYFHVTGVQTCALPISLCVALFAATCGLNCSLVRSNTFAYRSPLCVSQPSGSTTSLMTELPSAGLPVSPAACVYVSVGANQTSPSSHHVISGSSSESDPSPTVIPSRPPALMLGSAMSSVLFVRFVGESEGYCGCDSGADCSGTEDSDQRGAREDAALERGEAVHRSVRALRGRGQPGQEAGRLQERVDARECED